jgi:1-aminocyclopropane-1-carboxylate deaminase/D-cysteine desulfhydrase-like pyridoxal-dependent ACC family enzyme
MVDIPVPRLELAQLPTPLEPAARLSEAWGGPTIWMKRDDLTGFGLSGNKTRKLEYQFAAAREAGQTAVVTIGAIQSNHCRATALAAARLGFDCTLVLWSLDGEGPDQLTGNHLLHHLSGAKIIHTDLEGYINNGELLAGIAAEHGAMRVIPEGASDDLGMWGFVAAIDEFYTQWDALGIDAEPIIWHAASSGGTTAGMANGAGQLGRSPRIIASSVGEPNHRVQERLDEVSTDQSGWVTPELIDLYVGPGYGETTPEDLAIQAEATRLTVLLWDPTYTGKAIAGLKRHIDAGHFGADDHVVFWHTGGGFAVFAEG